MSTGPNFVIDTPTRRHRWQSEEQRIGDQLWHIFREQVFVLLDPTTMVSDHEDILWQFKPTLYRFKIELLLHHLGKHKVLVKFLMGSADASYVAHIRGVVGL